MRELKWLATPKYALSGQEKIPLEGSEGKA
jgi:hypothetical protein